MSQDLGRDVPELEKLHARKLWADFSYPINGPISRDNCDTIIAIPHIERYFFQRA